MQDLAFAIKLSDLFWLCAGIGTLIALYKAVQSINPVSRHTIQINKLEKRVDTVEEHLANDLEHFKQNDKVLDLIVESLFVLVQNEQTSNNSKEVENVAKKLHDYIFENK